MRNEEEEEEGDLERKGREGHIHQTRNKYWPLTNVSGVLSLLCAVVFVFLSCWHALSLLFISMMFNRT